MLGLAEGDVRGTSPLYFSVHDIAAVAASLTMKGVPFINAPHVVARMPDYELWLAEFRDSEGNVLALMEEKR
jgi:methylmalonyl-CoA/ethylmalonyl-CoA epimerase